MTVKELIAKLAQMPQELPVVIDGYEDGLDDVTGTTVIGINFETDREWWYGHHELNERSEHHAIYLNSNKKTGT